MSKNKLLFAFLFIVTDLIPQWNQVTLPIYGNYHDVYFSNREVGWICGSYGTLLKTTDGGLNWEVRTAGTNLHLNKIKFANFNIGWIVGQSGLILKTTDGGNSWIQKVSNTTEDINSLSFVDSLYLWASTRAGAVLHSSDGGETWQIQTRFSFGNLKVSFVSRYIGYVVGHSNPPMLIRRICKTTNGGLTWIWLDYMDGSQSIDIFFIDENYGWISGNYSSVLMTTNGGNNWIINPLEPNSGWSAQIFILKQGVGWVTTYSNEIRIYYTSNSGQDWIEQYNSGRIYSFGFGEIFFVDSAYGWAVGNDGLAFYTLNSGGVLNVEENSFLDYTNDYYLHQNHPNPFNPSTTISWQSPVGSWQTIKLYDLLGREIDTIVEGYYEAGTHSTLYIVNSTLSSGVYFYQLRAANPTGSGENFVQTRKMILLR